MRIIDRQPVNKKQEGIALLVLVITIALTLSAYYFSSISVVDIKVDDLEKTRTALKQAKQALINYAVTHADGNGSGTPGEYGYLPCPHTEITGFTAEGVQDGMCGNQHLNSLGYLPWVSMNMAALNDSSGNCLWYAVSGSYKNNINSGLINEDTNGMFQLRDRGGAVVAGAAPEDRIVAVILAPGPILNAQSRTIDTATLCGDDGANPSAYLEGNGFTDNATLSNIVDTVDQFIHATLTSDTEIIAPIPAYNDYLITITREEIWQAVMKSDLEDKFEVVAEAVAVCLAEYVNNVNNPNKRLPWPAPVDLIDYRDSINYDDASSIPLRYAGRFPLYVDDSNSVIINTIEDDFLNPTSATPPSGIICTNMTLPKAGLINVDLTDTSNEVRILLNNWKDHIFYAASKAYALPDIGHTGCGASDCVSIGSVPVQYAAIIFFAGRAQGAQSRVVDNTIPLDEKSLMLNYLEEGRDGVFPDATGNGAYNMATIPSSNDYLFCLTDSANPAVIDC